MAISPAILTSDQGRVSFAHGADLAEAARRAEAVFVREGVVVLDELVDPALIAAAAAEIAAGYPELGTVDPARNFGAYAGRHTMPLRLDGALAERKLVMPRALVELATSLLGQSFQLDSFGLLVSLPGAPDQTPHPDALLFPDKGLDLLLPPFALALALPLVPMDAVTGTTAFWRGSHRQRQVTGEPDFAPQVQPGSALLWDFRVWHRGLANHSPAPRPVLFGVLCREWWREAVSVQATRYEKLTLSRAAHDGFGGGLRRILARAVVFDEVERV